MTSAPEGAGAEEAGPAYVIRLPVTITVLSGWITPVSVSMMEAWVIAIGRGAVDRAQPAAPVSPIAMASRITWCALPARYRFAGRSTDARLC